MYLELVIYVRRQDLNRTGTQDRIQRRPASLSVSHEHDESLIHPLSLYKTCRVEYVYYRVAPTVSDTSLGVACGVWVSAACAASLMTTTILHQPTTDNPSASSC